MAAHYSEPQQCFCVEVRFELYSALYATACPAHAETLFREERAANASHAIPDGRYDKPGQLHEIECVPSKPVQNRARGGRCRADDREENK